MPDLPDHTHECRGCGASVDCWEPNDRCNDHPGDCAGCVAAEALRAAVAGAIFTDDTNDLTLTEAADAVLNAIDAAGYTIQLAQDPPGTVSAESGPRELEPDRLGEGDPVPPFSFTVPYQDRLTAPAGVCIGCGQDIVVTDGKTECGGEGEGICDWLCAAQDLVAQHRKAADAAWNPDLTLNMRSWPDLREGIDGFRLDKDRCYDRNDLSPHALLTDWWGIHDALVGQSRDRRLLPWQRGTWADRAQALRILIDTTEFLVWNKVATADATEADHG